MKIVFLFLLLCVASVHAETFVPSKLDPALAQVRELAFIPWSSPGEADQQWKKLSVNNVPIYNEKKPGLSRDLYIPNPGIPFWVVGGLSKKDLFKTHREKLAIDDTLISASVYTDEKGREVYWALWAPRLRADRVVSKMKEFGITQARIDYSLSERIMSWGTSFKTAEATFIIIIFLALIFLLLLLIAVLYSLNTLSRNAERRKHYRTFNHDTNKP